LLRNPLKVHPAPLNPSPSTYCGQDLLWKFNIPTSERLKVLKFLDAHNLNAFSLFGSEESLMETMALRELEFREKD
jgi:hypothetical protein